jgi:poly(3-hydroxybutyrate) depolymerase
MIRQARYRLVITGLVFLLASMAVTLTPSGLWALASARPLATVISCSEVTPAPGDYVMDLESSGQPRQSRLHIPPGYLAGHPAPLVINLHGLGGSGVQQDLLSGMSAKADEPASSRPTRKGEAFPRAGTSGRQSGDWRWMCCSSAT